VIYTAEKKEIGKVTHFFSKIKVIGFETKETLKIGDEIRIIGKGGAVDFIQTVESMQKDRIPIQEAKPGEVIGIQVSEEAPQGCCVFKI
jgi:hypothetical protein